MNVSKIFDSVIKRCPKTGTIVGINLKNKLTLFLLPFTGILALAWFLVRVLPKPSRATYPCMQAAGLTIFQIWVMISSFAASTFAFRSNRVK
jgi:hypothetical protein